MSSKTIAGGLLAVLGAAAFATDAEAGGGGRQTTTSTATSPSRATSATDSTSPPSAGTVDVEHPGGSLQERVNYFYSHNKTWRDPSTSFRGLAGRYGGQAVVDAVRDAPGADFGDVDWVARHLGVSQ